MLGKRNRKGTYNIGDVEIEVNGKKEKNEMTIQFTIDKEVGKKLDMVASDMEVSKRYLSKSIITQVMENIDLSYRDNKSYKIKVDIDEIRNNRDFPNKHHWILINLDNNEIYEKVVVGTDADATYVKIKNAVREYYGKDILRDITVAWTKEEMTDHIMSKVDPETMLAPKVYELDRVNLILRYWGSMSNMIDDLGLKRPDKLRRSKRLASEYTEREILELVGMEYKRIGLKCFKRKENKYAKEILSFYGSFGNFKKNKTVMDFLNKLNDTKKEENKQKKDIKSKYKKQINNRDQLHKEFHKFFDDYYSAKSNHRCRMTAIDLPENMIEPIKKYHGNYKQLIKSLGLFEIYVSKPVVK